MTLNKKIANLKRKVIRRIISAKWIKTKFDVSICYENELVNPIIQMQKEAVENCLKDIDNPSHEINCSFDVIKTIFKNRFGDLK